MLSIFQPAPIGATGPGPGGAWIPRANVTGTAERIFAYDETGHEICGYDDDAISPADTFEERSAETGLDYFGARYSAGLPWRFAGPDPVAVSIFNPQSLTWMRMPGTTLSGTPIPTTWASRFQGVTTGWRRSGLAASFSGRPGTVHRETGTEYLDSET